MSPTYSPHVKARLTWLWQWNYFSSFKIVADNQRTLRHTQKLEWFFRLYVYLFIFFFSSLDVERSIPPLPYPPSPHTTINNTTPQSLFFNLVWLQLLMQKLVKLHNLIMLNDKSFVCETNVYTIY